MDASLASSTVLRAAPLLSIKPEFQLQRHPQSADGFGLRCWKSYSSHMENG